MDCKRIVISGGPSSGKTTIINYLIKQEYYCFEEVSRELIHEAQKKGITQPFLSNPEEFNSSLLQARIQQFEKAKIIQNKACFYDRGILDIIGYMKYAKQRIPVYFSKAVITNRYDTVFLLPPWKQIHVQDNERYEVFEQAQEIYNNIKEAYKSFGYQFLEVPYGAVEYRANFILNALQ